MTIIASLFHPIIHLIDLGGYVLVAIMLAALLMWILILDRYWQLVIRRSQLMYTYRELSAAQLRLVYHRWQKGAVIKKCVSEFSLFTQHHIKTIAVLVKVNILLGLLGTIIGMIGLFDTVSVVGVDHTYQLTRGISRAIIPTLMGMSVALSGFFFVLHLRHVSYRLTQTFHNAIAGQ